MLILKKVSEVVAIYPLHTFITFFLGRLNNIIPLSINREIATRIYDIMSNLYSPEAYHFLPIFSEDTTNAERKILNLVTNKLAIKLTEYASILKLCNADITELQGLSYEKDFNKTYAKEKTNGNTYAMSENAPINADLETINTPNMKSQATSNGSKEFEGADNEKETNPYYYEKYLQILTKYNIFEIISDCCKSVIYEYNTLI